MQNTSLMQNASLVQNLLWVGAGGFIGSIARFALSLGIRALAPGFPIATLIINVLGSFAIGYIAGSAEKYSASTLLFLSVGVLGGFTTFSTFSLETLELIRHHQVGPAVANILLSVLLGLAAVWFGRSLA